MPIKKMKLICYGCFLIIICCILLTRCGEQQNEPTVRLITLDPGHFHAALVQKAMYEGVDTNVYVYAPDGPDLQHHLDKIKAYNQSNQNPTHWNEVIYLGNDFLKKMLTEKKGNVVVIAGNNQNKTEYIRSSIDNGLNILADKPMATGLADFAVLKNAFDTAAKKQLLLYDIMTERYEITNMLQRELSMIPEIFGVLKKGTYEEPAVEMESVHYFYKYVSGKILVRPAWFMDVLQQGEGITDVAVHLVDLVQWQSLPDRSIDFQNDIKLNSARSWSTDLTLAQFRTITNQDLIPDYLKKNIVKDSILKVFANGEINYRLHEAFVKLTARWDYKAPEGSGDTHYAILRGTRSNLVIRQGAEQNYKPTLYIEPVSDNEENYESQLLEKFRTIEARYPGLELKKTNKAWELIIPEKYKEGHEAHFSRVTEKFLGYLKNGNMPEWEVPNMLAKYFTTTQALELARKTQKNN